MWMIVIGSDPHKRSYSCQAVVAGTGELRSSESVPATTGGHERLLAWARGLDRERVWAVEDCRHVSGKLERFLLARGERVVRVAPKLMAGRRRGSRQAGKSDPIDALAVARAALEEGVETLPAAQLAGPAREVKLLLDHREDLVAERTRVQNRLRWLLHDRWPELELPAGCLDRYVWLDRLARRLARASQDADVRVMRAQARRLKDLTREAAALERELRALVQALQPRLLQLPGVGTLTAAKLIAEIAGIERFRTPAKLARLAGLAPIPASSGNRHRMRLHRGGNRQLNAAFHRIAVTQLRTHQPAKDYIARKLSEGKTKTEALRCLKRHLVRTIYTTMTTANANAPANAPALT
ncbi:MAG TPA: IS110 family transposase [Kofleriaceae bacterium]|nr:IS110 family transposase [Kofleriaceae bacterium]